MKTLGIGHLRAQRSMLTTMGGHFWTIAPTVRHRIVPVRAPRARSWETIVDDRQIGAVKLTGLLREEPGAEDLVIVIHGLGGEVATGYCVEAARAAAAAGLSCLRLALRGADRLGADYHHAGLTDDVAAALASEVARRHRRVFLLGYSLGGHVALRSAVDEIDGQIAAVAAVCPPLDLEASQRAIDAPSRWLYRRHVLRGLRTIYEAVARRRPVPTPLERIALVKTLREWDRLTVVPRFGFRDVTDYYAQASVGPRLGDLRVPGLIVASHDDPMIPAESVLPSVAHSSAALEVSWVRGGGHVFLGGNVELGLGTSGSTAAQIMEWFKSRGRA